MNNEMHAAVVAAKEIIREEMLENTFNTNVLEYFPALVRYYSHQSIKLGQALCLVMYMANWVESWTDVQFMMPSTENCMLNMQFSKQLLKRGFSVYAESQDNGSVREISRIRF